MACGGGDAVDASGATSAGADTTATSASSVGTSGDAPTGTSGSTGAGATSEQMTGEGTAGAEPVAWAPTLIGREYLCKLISREQLEDPTENHTQTRFNLTGTDLGVPVVADDVLYLLFGDTIGYREIWPIGEDPDSLAWIPLATVRADPTSVCRELEFLVTPDVPSVAADVDLAILRDFAGVFMQPPAGEAIETYVRQPAGPFSNMPGTFEVPGGALAVDGVVYVAYAGAVELQPRTRATRSYLARWDGRGEGVPAYQIVRTIDALVDGALAGHFIQVAPVLQGETVYLFGTGDYRRSGVYLARVPVAGLTSGAGTEVFDAATNAWAAGPAVEAAPLFEGDGVGELGVQWIAEAGVYALMYQRELHDGDAIVDNRVVLRVASAPEGPWSEALTIVDMADPQFALQHCCGVTCVGDQILHCEKAGLYATYLLPAITTTVEADGLTLTLPFLASTWDPYNVALFAATVRLVDE